MSSSRRELDDTAPATDVPSDPGRRSRPDTFVPPSERYQLGSEIGRGGMGRVVEAVDTKLGRTVALKEVLPRTGEAVERRFLREIRVTARLEHPSIVPVYDSGVNAEGRPFYVMRRVTGRPLDELIKRARGLDERLTLLPAVLRAIDAIAHAHRRGVIHRDLKPANILVGELGESIVIDWGLAKVIGETDPDEPDSLSELKAGDSLQTQFGAVFGTPGFMPPEQARGELQGFGGDVYALGATLYQLLAGTPPHHGASVTDVMDKTVSTNVTPLRALAPGAPVELAAIVDKALAFEAAQRYQDASELAADVRRFEAGQLVAAHHYTSRQRLRRFVRRYRSLLVLGAIALSALTVFGVLGIMRVYAEKAAAQAARDAAQRNAAELQDQAHELTLANATALVATNPTKALAYLKQIPSSSRFQARARGLAQSAYARGVAWGMKGPAPIHRTAELSPSESRVLWQNRGSELRVYDLDQRSLLLTLPIESEMNAVWVDDDHFIMTGKHPAVIDVTTGAARTLDMPPVFGWAVSAKGTVAVAQLEDRTTRIVDLVTGTHTPVPRPQALGIVAMSNAGTWVAVTDTQSDVSFHDITGRELGRLDLQAAWAFPLPDDSMMIAGFKGVYRCRRDATPLCTEIALDRAPNDLITTATRAGTAVLVTTGRNNLFVVDGDTVRTFDMATSLATVKGNTRIPLGVDRDTIYIPTPIGWLPLDVPQTLIRARVSVGARRAVVFGDELITVFEYARWLPRRVDIRRGHQPAYITDDTIVAHGFAMMEGLDWLDARTLAVVSHAELPIPVFAVRYTPTGDLVGSSMLMGESTTKSAEVIYVPFRSPTVQSLTTSTDAPILTAFAEGTVVVVRNGNELVMYRGGQPTSSPLKLPGNVITIAVSDSTRFAALLDSKELVIGDRTTATVDRYPLDAMPSNSLVATQGSTVCATLGRTVAIWRDRRFVPIAELQADPEWIGLMGGTLIAHFTDSSAVTVNLETGATSLLFEPAMDFVWANRHFDVLATFTKSSQVEILDLTTQSRWDLPVLFRRDQRSPSISPDGTRLLVSSTYGTFEWRLQRVGEDYDGWLAGATNALIKDGNLTWDWDSKARLAP